MKKNKKTDVFKYIFIIIFVTYTIIFGMVNMGYYEYTSYRKKALTEEQIKKFETDIKEGNPIDINNYVYNDETFLIKNKRMPLKISEFISNMTIKCVNIIFNYLNKLIK